MIRTIAEIGINHNGDFATALKLQEAAAQAGCWAVKYQIRTNFHACVPQHLWHTKRKWRGKELDYFDYRAALEFDDQQLRDLYQHAKSLGLEWFASPWDVESVARLASIQRTYCKVASAGVTNYNLLDAIGRASFRTVFVSSGMSTERQLQRAVEFLQDGPDDPHFVFMACTSVYPCPDSLCNVTKIESFWNLTEQRTRDIGYSGHETGVLPSLYAGVLGATYIERHLTLDKSMEGSDHAASLEPHEMKELCDRLAEIPAILGDGKIGPIPEERPSIEKLRGIPQEVACG